MDRAGALHRGQRIGERYEIEEEIGRGGMASVYRAMDTRHQALVALKILNADLAALLGPTRFDREIRITAQLQHPNIVPILDSGTHEQVPYYVMPFVRGESLAARLRREGILGVADAVHITVDVAKALTAAHKVGVIHRDVKPANILLHEDQVLLADFGVARAVSLSGSEQVTDSGIALGTASYMSPEQAAGSGVDHRADIYSLGCVLYELLAGTPPFTGPAQMVIARHSLEEAPALHGFRRDVPEGVEIAVRRAMAKVAGDRFATVDEFSKAVQEGLNAGGSYQDRIWRRRLRVGAGATGAALMAALLYFIIRGPAAPLDRTRVMVFPLVVPAGFTGAPTAGEDAATMIGSALDGTDPLRWIDGWSQLAPAQRDSMRDVPLRTLTKIAAGRRCGWAVTGRIVMRGDSAAVALELHDVGAATLADEKTATGATAETWRTALEAVTALLPTLIPEGARRLADELEHRPPAAIASFLQGEAAFRRLNQDEAFVQYERAVRADTTFALAALRGAQVSSWRHRTDDAAAMLDRMEGLPLPERYQAFATGYRAYLSGAADSAVVGFTRAIALDPEMLEAWTQLGEVYTHLLPAQGNSDSLALIALRRAHELDPAAKGPQLHLIELGLRSGSPQDANSLVNEFLAGGPDSLMALRVSLLQRCATRGAGGVSWPHEVTVSPLEVLFAAIQFAGGGARPECAEQAFRAILVTDTAATDDAENRRFYSAFGLLSVLASTGRGEEAVRMIDGYRERWGSGASLFLEAAPLHEEFRARAFEVARVDSARSRGTYREIAGDNRVWQLGVFEGTLGNVASAKAAIRELERRAAATPASSGMRLARSVEARLALRAADTARAVVLLESLVPPLIPSGTVQWDLALPMAGERLLLARLLSAHGDDERALATASVLDAASPVVHLLFLREQLEFRAATAERLGKSRSANQYRGRLDALTKYRSPAGP